MSRFIAKYAKYGHGIRAGRYMVLADGQRQELTKELFVRFNRAVPTEEEQNLGIASLQHAGLPHDRDTEEHFSPRSRISGFDTEAAQEMYGWTDGEREIVETVLRNSSNYGVEFIEVTEKPVAQPWPTYDSMDDVKQILQAAELIGVPLEDVIKYEKANRNSDLIVTELEYALASGDPEAEEVLVIQA
jgi:hypothetical protein